jgi:ABC-2 type transport system ATP-binding protein
MGLQRPGQGRGAQPLGRQPAQGGAGARLLHRPRVLLMDEATVGLDPASRQQLLDTVRGLCREQGLAVLWATHLIEEVKTADRLLLLHQGTVRFDGDIGTFMAAAEGPDFQTEVLRALQKA